AGLGLGPPVASLLPPRGAVRLGAAQRRTNVTLPAASQDAIDRFVDALWIEDGLAANTRAAYRRDLTLYAEWLGTAHGRAINTSTESDLREYSVTRHAGSKATTSN